ncbi:XRE family transcriptional regulator [Sinomonas atrocyanea]|jgi:transcriptional regulator with XRE-family HTH domain|uniref:helix-turn-helix domain-containing protein n=1 Tax=Sinomonas atrocyanea TaxID=37927 RepID=UPI00285B81B5|nr:XRE family transcriptional regulator [Sinomonas atrocyanea]MDR6621090.1 transcriptional regulator with XRE-family HTH domain [Sinomonas atrocyanea]
MTTESIPGTPAATSALLASVGTKVRSRRKELGMTLAQLSDATGLSQAIVSQIERGLANPSFTTLAQLAHGLDIPVGRFFAGQADGASPVVRKSERRNLKGVTRESVGEAVHELLTPSLNGALEVQWIVTPPGHDTSATPFHHSGEEFCLVVSGRKDVYLDGVRYSLSEGDSITYNSEIPHWYANSYEEPCVAIWVSAPRAW